ncbi:MAG: Tex family protein [Humidesulfovibrio sp.]|uniref:Tex family protein n=1 Tax=Humidesulfovibrio sp. TaxID=2910988 RepID=UPI0027FF01CB|nr:Tex family protein [Humidesulfovibrio sp.]MDQ7836377.1 Tex family protein [Humidesulfovibrio sp.]
MTENHCPRIAKEMSLSQAQVAAVARLVSEGATVPFMARYRKEATGSLDEVAIAAIRDRLEDLAELDKRREAIVASLEERGLLTPELKKAVDEAQDKARLEDVYLPYRPKRRTRAAMAREKGLEPLAKALFIQQGGQQGRDALALARPFVDEAKGVPDAEAALSGARDILAEQVAEEPRLRASVRDLFARRGRFQAKVVKGKEQAGATYRDWFAWDEALRTIPGHRALAMFRGEAEGFLTLSLRPPEEDVLELARRAFLRGRGPVAVNSDTQQVDLALADGVKRLLCPSLENELRAEVKARADAEAIRVFAANLRGLLLAPPLGQKRVLALDPGFRTGAKLAVLDAQGALKHHATIYPTTSASQREAAAATLKDLCARHQVEAIGIGNGTAGRETEAFVRGLDLGIPVALVNEAGASIYSASDIARREFPDLDLTVRGAVSIGRRLMDPLAELVKLDPKSIGVGQYQHDVDQAGLRKALNDVVMSCVNAVGVDVNTASQELLAHVSGLGPVLAKNIVEHRTENGPFQTRDALRKVKRLGPKAYEQAAGFLRVRGPEPLDLCAVHPERYALVKRMARDAKCTVAQLLADAGARAQVRLADYVDGDTGLPTLTDIMAELDKPGRDPREGFSAFAFAEGVGRIEDLEPGMELPGLVTNVTKFGAFVDVGVHRDGMVHVSQLADRFVADPAQVVRVGQEVLVRVTEVDLQRGRIGLSMRGTGRKVGG